MNAHQRIDVAVLLATYNGAKHVEQQIKSLAANAAPFTLHWLDDHSTDNTRMVVRNSASEANIRLKEWHQTEHQGLPGSFFQLLECVEADIYLFCDQDDIWQAAKIDAAVAYLSPDTSSPRLCYSDSILFWEDGSRPPCRLSYLVGTKDLVRASQLPATFLSFSPTHAAGHTQGFTRRLRDIYLSHRDIARKYAFMHDLWMHDIAVAAGSARLLVEAPTVLCRMHDGSVSASFDLTSNGISRRWVGTQLSRQAISRHLQGFILASGTLAPGGNRDRLLELAKLVATIDHRQTLAKVVQLARRGATFPRWSDTAWLFAACLCSSAHPQ